MCLSKGERNDGRSEVIAPHAEAMLEGSTDYGEDGRAFGMRDARIVRARMNGDSVRVALFKKGVD